MEKSRAAAFAKWLKFSSCRCIAGTCFPGSAVLGGIVSGFVLVKTIPGPAIGFDIGVSAALCLRDFCCYWASKGCDYGIIQRIDFVCLRIDFGCVFRRAGVFTGSTAMRFLLMMISRLFGEVLAV
ncbi:MAG: hypothetical protein V8Q17_02865 [Acutalibacteraceae bacterium]